MFNAAFAVSNRSLIADAEAQEESREEADERVHALVPAREEEDHRAQPGRAQRRDL